MPVTANTNGLQAVVDAENAKGYRGARVDPNPNSAYSFETDPMTSPRAPRHGTNFVEIDPWADPENPSYAHIYGKLGLDTNALIADDTAVLLTVVPAQPVAGTVQTTGSDSEPPFDATVTAATFTPTATITGDPVNNRTFKLRNATKNHPLYTLTTTATLNAGVAAAMVADGADQSVSAGDELTVIETVGGTGVAHGGGKVNATVVEIGAGT